MDSPPAVLTEYWNAAVTEVWNFYEGSAGMECIHELQDYYAVRKLPADGDH